MTYLQSTPHSASLRSRRSTPPASPRLVASPRRPLPSAVVRGSLGDGLKVCLGLLAREPERFEQAAVVWHGRLCAGLPGIDFADSRALLSALEALTGPNPPAAGRALRATCLQHGLDDMAAVLDAWLDRCPRSVLARLAPRAPDGPTAS